MFTCFIKRVLPFIMTLIFGIGLGSIFGGSTSQRTQLAPSYSAPQQQPYRGCRGKRSYVENSTPSQSSQSSERSTRAEQVQVSQ